MVITALVAVLVSFGVAATALLGRQGRFAGVAGQSVAVLPLVGVCAAFSLAQGLGLLWAVLAGVSVVIAVVGAGVFAGHDRAGGSAGSPGDAADSARSSLSWICGLVISLGLAGLLVSWLAWLIDFSSSLSRTVVVLVISVAGLLTALGPGSARVWSRIFLGVAIAAAVLLLVGGVLAGDPGSLTNPVVQVGSPDAFGGVMFAIVVVIVGAAHPGLQLAARRDRGALVAAGVVMALVVVAVLVGLLMLAAGGIRTPSFPLFTILAFVPESGKAILVGLFTLAAVLALARTLRDAADLESRIQPRFVSGAGSAWRVGFLVVCVALVAITALASVPPVGTVGLIAVAGIVRLVAGHRGEPDESEPASPDSQRESAQVS